MFALSTLTLDVFNEDGPHKSELSVVQGSAINHGRTGPLGREFRVSLAAAKKIPKKVSRKVDAKQVCRRSFPSFLASNGRAWLSYSVDEIYLDF